jgi:hypothetical protein
MERRTEDGRLIELSSDGAMAVTWARSYVAGPMRTSEGQERALKVGRVILAWAETMPEDEIADLYRRGRKLDPAPDSLADLRKRLEGAAKLPPLAWRTTSADRQGRPTERYARLPRLRWPGMWVLDTCGGPGSSRGRYQLMAQIGAKASGDVTVKPMGLAFKTLAELWAHLSAS